MARPVWEEIHLWIAWFTPAWQAQHVPSTGGRGGDGFRHHQASHPMRDILDFENAGVLGGGLIWRGRCGVLVSVITRVASPLCGLALWFCLTGAVR